MIQSLKDILVVSDIDNTLVDPKEGMPSVNEVTIRLFCSLGGRFTVATGRTVESVEHQLVHVPLSAPIIADGGAVIYDFATKQRIQNIVLPTAVAMRALQDVWAAFPGVGIEVMSADGRLYIIQSNDYTHAHTVQEHLAYTMSPLAEIRTEWNKVLFACNPEMLRQIQEYVQVRYYPGLCFVHTAPTYFEILPAGVTKGTALKSLCDHLQIPVENTIMIGDYFNDRDIMQTAGHSIAVANAPKEIQVLADEVTTSCKDGGVAQVLYRLISAFGM
jgi:Cof subfamily protein (haloacid dehalogenase superfamily)